MDILSKILQCYDNQTPLFQVFSYNEVLRISCDDNSELRAAIAQVLVWDAPDSYAEKILHCLSSDFDELVRLQAIDSLSEYPSLKSYHIMKNALHEQDELIRAYAAFGMGMLGKQYDRRKSKKSLHKLLEKERSDYVCAAVFCGLYMLDEKSALQKMIKLFNSPNYYAQCYVLRSLCDLYDSCDSFEQQSIRAFAVKLEKSKYSPAVSSSIQKLQSKIVNSTEDNSAC